MLGEDGCTAYFDAESSMLILQGATLTDSIRCDDDMTLKLLDTNTVDGSIFVSGALTVEGPGTLQITTDERAFDVRETLTINGGTITMDGTLGWREKPLMVGRTGVTINSGTVSSSNARNAYAIDCYENGVITINGGL